MAENPNWENDDSLFIKALLCWMHRDSIAFVVETEKKPKIGRLLLQKSFASCVCCTVAIDLPAPRRQFDNVALLPLQLPKVLQSRSLTSQSCPTVLHTLVVQVGEKRKQKKCRHFVVWSLASSSFFFIFYFFFFFKIAIPCHYYQPSAGIPQAKVRWCVCSTITLTIEHWGWFRRLSFGWHLPLFEMFVCCLFFPCTVF